MSGNEIKFHSTINSRFVGNKRRVIRSDQILCFTDDDIALLSKFNIKSVIDLRSDDEVLKNPCNIPDSLKYYHIPLHENGILPCDGDKIAGFYYQIVTAGESVYNVLKTIADHDCGAVCFCRSGKDRTGIITALLLSLCGFSDEYISADYAQTEKNMRGIIDKWLLWHPSYSMEAVSPMPKHISGLLKLIREEYISIENYCRHIGLTDTDINNIKNLIL